MGRISNGKLAIHVRCYDELRKMDFIVESNGKRRNKSFDNTSMRSLLEEPKNMSPGPEIFRFTLIVHGES